MRELIIKNIEEFNGLGFLDDVSSLRIVDVEIGNQGLIKLLGLLASNDNLHSLILNNNGIDFSDFEIANQLTNFLENNKTLTNLSLSGNLIGNMSAAMLFIALNQQNNVQILHLDYTGINMRDDNKLMIIEALGYNESLKELRIAGNSVDDDLALEIIQVMGDRDFSLITTDQDQYQFAEIFPEKLQDIAGSSSAKQKFKFYKFNLNDDNYPINHCLIIETLGGTKPILETIYLDEDLELDFYGVGINNEDLQSLLSAISVDFPLKKLALDNNLIDFTKSDSIRVFDSLINFIESNPDLTGIDLSSNLIGDFAAAKILASLNVQNSVVSLVLDYSGISMTDDLSTAIIIDSLKNNHSLTTLSLVGNGISKEMGLNILTMIGDGKNLSLIISNEEELKLSGSKVAELSRAISKINNQPKFQISDQDKKELLALMAGHTEINFKNKAIDDYQLEMLLEIIHDSKTIIELNLPQNEITNKGLEILISFLKENPHLKKLDLSGNQIDNQGVKTLIFAIKDGLKLDSIKISGPKINEILGNFLQMIISDNFNPSPLDIISELGVGKIANSVEERQELLSIFQELASDLHSKEHHRPINIEEDRRGFDDEFEKIIHELDSLSKENITNLDLSNLDIDGRKLKLLSEILGNIPSLVSLNLDSNKIDDDSAAILAKLIKQNHNLQQISLSGNLISHVGARIIIESIKEAKIRNASLILSNNPIDEERQIELQNISGKLTTQVIFTEISKSSETNSKSKSHIMPTDFSTLSGKSNLEFPYR